MSLVVNVRKGLRERLLTVAGLPAGRKWEGKSFTPTTGEPWIRETMLRSPAPPQRMSVGPFARLRHTGLYQVSLFYPPDGEQDVFPIESMAEAVRAAFPDTLEFTYNGQRIRVHGAGLQTVDEETDPDWLHVPVTIDWSADTFNAN